jgi:hypothetical protein
MDWWTNFGWTSTFANIYTREPRLNWLCFPFCYLKVRSWKVESSMIMWLNLVLYKIFGQWNCDAKGLSLFYCSSERARAFLNFLSQITMPGSYLKVYRPNRQNLKYFWIWWNLRSDDEFVKKMSVQKVEFLFTASKKY